MISVLTKRTSPFLSSHFDSDILFNALCFTPYFFYCIYSLIICTFISILLFFHFYSFHSHFMESAVCWHMPPVDFNRAQLARINREHHISILFPSPHHNVKLFLFSGFKHSAAENIHSVESIHRAGPKSNAPTNPYAEVLGRPRREVADASWQTSTQGKPAKPTASEGENRKANRGGQWKREWQG